MLFENTIVMGIANAMIGMRNPLESWDISDSFYSDFYKRDIIGPNDMALAQKLIKAGPEHRKFLRQIFVSVRITAPLYWWKEFDTYKIGVVANSTSTMHKLASTEITKECFEHGELLFSDVIKNLEELRTWYNGTKNKDYWKQLIVNLPESWLQIRTVTMNYENVYNMYTQRKKHKLTEWSVDFINWVTDLQYASFFIDDNIS